MSNPFFTSFKKPTNEIELPKKFTFPFYYEPHELAILASEELQDYLKDQSDINHGFGLEGNTHEIGKMFGVLVVENENKKIGYLSAFSGNISNQNELSRFVPPIYNILAEDSFFKTDNDEIVALSQQLSKLEKGKKYIALKEYLKKIKKEANNIVSKEKERLKIRKKNRKKAKNKQEILTAAFKSKQQKESLNDTFYLRELQVYYDVKYSKQEKELAYLEKELLQLKQLRIEKSNTLQQKIVAQYSVINTKGEAKSVVDIFDALNRIAPSGTGDCAAPKLLQYAFSNKLKPLALAEFWWGKPGNSKIRKHKNYYPSCQGKCEPLFEHMLTGIELDKNLLIENFAKDKKIKILYEDEQILVIHKPTELLSVPGKILKDSVYNRLVKKYPDSEKYLIIHRLDMSTSGIMLLAKNKQANQFLQKQFITREIKKRYTALLDGVISDEYGEVDLPLRVDLDDRPKQLVCYEHGKKALTKWKVLERKNGNTRIEFTPITGRTHQLRVHAAHVSGLNTPIVGDDLYGTKAGRLHLQATYIQFTHPKTKNIMEFSLEPEF
ncbi:MAG TPA: RluA family pseudouridine synthase [Lutibacter sp.]|nr:RluA family pseudouridine synthase [Lutibacter sp.]